MNDWDYIIVGAGAAGCVLAERLSLDPRNRVLLIEAGGDDRNPFIHMPRGIAKLFGNSKLFWQFQTEADGDVPSETWVSGKLLGGSTSINGMVYLRGQSQDYDGWEALGARGWSWNEMRRCFRAIENHALGGNAVRGGQGPVGISMETVPTPLTEAIITAGEQAGMPRLQDLNDTPADGQGVGYLPCNIHKGRRQSSAVAFLRKALARPNLTLMTGVFVDKALLEGMKCIGVEGIVDGERHQFAANREVILSAGSLMSPQILQRSGVGAGALLQELGIPVVADSPGVGQHMHDHRMMMMQYEINIPYSDNFRLKSWRLVGNVLRYYLQRKGAMAVAYATIGAFARVLAESQTADVEFLFSPLAASTDLKGNLVLDNVHSIQLASYPLRPRSEGSVRITSADPLAPAAIRAGYLRDPYDQRVTVGMFRFIRHWLSQPAIAPIIVKERSLFTELSTDEEIVDAARKHGGPGYHSSGTCRMGDFPDAVLDNRCRVRGVECLRVVDASIMPALVSANTTGPIMASAWRAAELVQA